MYLTTTQLGTLRTFYKVTVRGSDVFTFPDPENNASTVNCRFTGSPVVSAMASKTGLWSVTLPMEIIP
jgi:hypothetical protein